jgi:hypothetical protein
LFHWGTQEEKLRYMQQSWSYNATGDRNDALWLNQLKSYNHISSYTLNFVPDTKNFLSIPINQLFNNLKNEGEELNINRLGIGYGIWGRINPKGKKFTSGLDLNTIKVSNNNKNKTHKEVLLNKKQIIPDTVLKYGQIIEKRRNKKELLKQPNN